MNFDDDLLETNGLVSTQLFDIQNSTTVAPKSSTTSNDDTKEYLNRNLNTRDPINISQNLSQPWPTYSHKNNKPIISNTIEDVTKDNYFKYNKTYISVDDNKASYGDEETNPLGENFALKNNSELNFKRYVLIPNARYIINLNKSYNDIYKIRLVDFGLYNLSETYIPFTPVGQAPVSAPLLYTPYILLRIQPLATKEVDVESNFEVASSEINEERQILGQPYTTTGSQLLTYSMYESYTTSFSKIRFYRARRPVDADHPITYDDFIEPIYNESEMIYKDPIQNISRLLVTIYDSEGNVYRSMQQHHFTLEITEKINVLKNTNINTKDGEVDISGVAKSNPLLFN